MICCRINHVPLLPILLLVFRLHVSPLARLCMNVQGTCRVRGIRAAFDLGSGATKIAIVAIVEKETSAPSKLERVVSAAADAVDSLRPLPTQESTVLRRFYQQGHHEWWVLFEEEAELLLGHSMQSSQDRSLDPVTVTTLHGILTRFMSKARAVATRHQAPLEVAAVATAVYREAANGPLALHSVEQIIGRVPRLVSQAEEAVLGFTQAQLAAGCAAPPPMCDGEVSDEVARGFVSWDSGGASFQLAFAPPLAPGQREELGPRVRHPSCVYQGRWGASKAFHAALRLRRPRLEREGPAMEENLFESTSNPFSVDEANTLIDHIKLDLLSPSSSSAIPRGNPHRPTGIVPASHAVGQDAQSFRSMVVFGRSHDDDHPLRQPAGSSIKPLQVQPSPRVVAIGGPTSAFSMCERLVGASRRGRAESAERSMRSGHPPGDRRIIHVQELRIAMQHSICGRNDTELSAAGFPQAAMVGPKICLIIAVAEVFGIATFEYAVASGSTLAVTVLPQFWNNHSGAVGGKL